MPSRNVGWSSTARVRIKLGSVLMILFRSLTEKPETGPGGGCLIGDRSWNAQLYLRAGSEFTQDRQFRSDLFGALVPTAPASRLQRTLRRNRPGRLGTLLRRRSGSMLHTTRSNLRELAAHIRTSETAGGAEVPVSLALLKVGLAAIRWSILRPPSHANIRQSPFLSSAHLFVAPHRP